MWIGAAILELELNLCRATLGGCQRACCQLAFQTQQLGGRLGDIDIQGVELLDGGQVVGLLRRDQSPFGDAGFTNAARDGSRDSGIVEVDLGTFQCRLGNGDLGDRLLPASLGIIVVLGADRLEAFTSSA